MSGKKILPGYVSFFFGNRRVSGRGGRRGGAARVSRASRWLIRPRQRHLAGAAPGVELLLTC